MRRRTLRDPDALTRPPARPPQRANEAPNPHTNLLALTPDSADAVAVIGHARDLGMCAAGKRDGSACGAWCDKRVADVCEYHVQRAVQGKRASRPEFSVGCASRCLYYVRAPRADGERAGRAG